MFVQLHHALDQVGGGRVAALLAHPVRGVVQGAGGQEVAPGVRHIQHSHWPRVVNYLNGVNFFLCIISEINLVRRPHLR